MIDALSTAQGFLCLTLRDPSLSRQARDDLEAASRYLQEAIAGTQALSDTLRGE